MSSFSTNRRKNLPKTYSKKGRTSRARKAFSVYTDEIKAITTPSAKYKRIPEDESSSLASSKSRSIEIIIPSKIRSQPESDDTKLSRKKPSARQKKEAMPSSSSSDDDKTSPPPSRALKDKNTLPKIVSMGDYDALTSSPSTAKSWLRAARCRLLPSYAKENNYARLKQADTRIVSDDELSLPVGRYAVRYDEEGRSEVSRLVEAADDEMSDAPVAECTPRGKEVLERIVEEEEEGARRVVVKKKGRGDLRGAGKVRIKSKVKVSEVSLMEEFGLGSEGES